MVFRLCAGVLVLTLNPSSAYEVMIQRLTAMLPTKWVPLVCAGLSSGEALAHPDEPIPKAEKDAIRKFLITRYTAALESNTAADLQAIWPTAPPAALPAERPYLWLKAEIEDIQVTGTCPTAASCTEATAYFQQTDELLDKSTSVSFFGFTVGGQYSSRPSPRAVALVKSPSRGWVISNYLRTSASSDSDSS
jgi:hypothetical protein